MNELDVTTPDVSTNGHGAASILGHLKQRREEIRESEFLVLPVPRWTDPEVFVRYRPVPHQVLRRAQENVGRVPKKERFEAEVNGNIDALIHGCIGVFARLPGDEHEYSLRVGDHTGELTKFDPDLALNLGLAEDEEGARHVTAREVVKALFITEGDIISHANELATFSGYRETEADTGVLGE